MRALVFGSLVLLGACASIAGLEDPHDEATSPGDDAGIDSSAPPPPPPNDAGEDRTTVDAPIDAPDGGDAGRPPTCDENGLLGRWKLDEGSGTTAFDCTSKKHDGTITGAQWFTGKVGPGALRFSADVLDVGNPQDFQLTGSMTLTAWIRIDPASGSSGRIVSKSSMADRGWDFNIEGGNLEFKVATAATSFYELTTPIDTGQWRHVAAVYVSGASSSMRLFIDGQEKVSLGPVTATQRGTPHNVQIGAMPAETCCRFDGDIDDVRIYGRALSTMEVQTVFAAK